MNITLIPKTTVVPTTTNGTTGDYRIGQTFFDPFSPIDLWTRRWPDLFKEFDAVTSPGFSIKGLNPWKEDGDKFTYETELPRFKANSIDVTTENGQLHISAEQDSLKYYNSISLPKNVDIDTIDAKLDHGVLYISISRKEEAKQRKVKIKVA